MLHPGFNSNVDRVPKQTMHSKTGHVAHTKRAAHALGAWGAWGVTESDMLAT
jgi:hypothetical protein